MDKTVVKTTEKGTKKKKEESAPLVPMVIAAIAKMSMDRKRRKGLIEASRPQAVENFYRDNIANNYHKPLGIIFTSISELNKYGSSLRIYFSFIEQLLWLSLAICLLSVTNIYINYNGGYYNGTNINAKSDPARGS